MNRHRPILLIHGGAGTRALSRAQRRWLEQALVEGHGALREGASAIDAVETSIRILEGSGVFNAGLGSNRQLDGVTRMDASIMEGLGLRAGAVASIEDVVHPIAAAHLVLKETAHVLLAGPPATELARYFKLDPRPSVLKQVRRRPRRRRLTERALRTAKLFETMSRAKLALKDRHGRETVGAVALDGRGTLAAGASTGGIEVMLPGRVGDTPLIGCGIYADNRAGAVSMTGWGESIIRLVVAKEIVDRMVGGASPAKAIRAVFAQLISRIRGEAGALVLAPDGRFVIRHTTPRMAAGHWDGRGKPVIRDRFEE
ncbi:MAG TPA: isoaspartyl peptidase/L-asparaginase family protein [Nitrospiraceae bacterium]|nr:isoaspartyl peptidase/L-asparaginase family protein [Nitrospiraceae bacterium]